MAVLFQESLGQYEDRPDNRRAVEADDLASLRVDLKYDSAEEGLPRGSAALSEWENQVALRLARVLNVPIPKELSSPDYVQLTLRYRLRAYLARILNVSVEEVSGMAGEVPAFIRDPESCPKKSPQRENSKGLCDVLEGITLNEPPQVKGAVRAHGQMVRMKELAEFLNVARPKEFEHFMPMDKFRWVSYVQYVREVCVRRLGVTREEFVDDKKFPSFLRTARPLEFPEGFEFDPEKNLELLNHLWRLCDEQPSTLRGSVDQAWLKGSVELLAEFFEIKIPSRPHDWNTLKAILKARCISQLGIPHRTFENDGTQFPYMVRGAGFHYDLNVNDDPEKFQLVAFLAEIRLEEHGKHGVAHDGWRREMAVKMAARLGVEVPESLRKERRVSSGEWREFKRVLKRVCGRRLKLSPDQFERANSEIPHFIRAA